MPTKGQKDLCGRVYPHKDWGKDCPKGSKSATSAKTGASRGDEDIIRRLLSDPIFGAVIKPYAKVDELRPLLVKLAPREWGGGGWTVEKFLAAVQATKWYTQRNEDELAWKTLTEGDKEQRIRSIAAEMYDYLRDSGGTDWVTKKGYTDLFRKIGDPGGQLRYWAWKVASGQMSMTEWELRLAEGMMKDPTSDLAIQQLAHREEMARMAKRPEEIGEELWQSAHGDYFLPLSKETAKRWADAIINGKASFGEFKDYMRKEAAELYPKWAESINNGVLPKALFGPAMGILSDELEMSEEAIKADPTLWGQLTNNASGAGDAFTAADWTRYARSTPRYRYTKGGNERAAYHVDSLLRRFGAIA